MNICTIIALALGCVFIGMMLIELQILMMQRKGDKRDGKSRRKMQRA